MDNEIEVIGINTAEERAKIQSSHAAKRYGKYTRERGSKMSTLTENQNRHNGKLSLHPGYLAEMLQLPQGLMTPEEFDEYMKLDNDDIDLSEVLRSIPDFTGCVHFADEDAVE